MLPGDCGLKIIESGPFSGLLIEHPLRLPFAPVEHAGKENFVVDELPRLLFEPVLWICQHRGKTAAGFGPVFFQERDLGQIEAGVPALRIDLDRSPQDDLRALVLALPGQDQAAQVQRLRFVFRPRHQRIELIQIVESGAVATCFDFAQCSVVDRPQFRGSGTLGCQGP